MSDFIKSFRDLTKMPVALWLVIMAFSIDAMSYFGMLTLMTEYFSGDIGVSDARASIVVSIFTGAVTLFMIGVGGAVEKFGIRRGLLVALALTFVGRVIYSSASMLPGHLRWWIALAGLLIVALGEGILQPVAYAGVKQYTDDKCSSMGYAFLYGFMNLAIVLSGLISPAVRVPVDALHKAGQSSFSGVAAVNWAFALAALLLLIVFALGMSKTVESRKIRDLDERNEGAATSRLGLLARVKLYLVGTKEEPSPLTDIRFMFFIFMLLPVRTLFAHQWLTMPSYILRTFDAAVGDRMEWLVNWINPGIIFFGVPILTALTRRVHIYTMMIIGTLVSAVPTFLLCGGSHLSLLILNFAIFSIGEALWSSRFLEYSSELAPKGRVSQYMGIANIPWILAKTTTGLYSGLLLSRFIPKPGPGVVQQAETLWAIYGAIALLTPIGLVLARGWVMKGLKQTASSQ